MGRSKTGGKVIFVAIATRKGNVLPRADNRKKEKGEKQRLDMNSGRRGKRGQCRSPSPEGAIIPKGAAKEV